jgi:hypothetical protein
MSANDPAHVSALFRSLIENLQLRGIQPFSINYQRLGNLEAPNAEVQIKWEQAFRTDDPTAAGDNVIAFHPRYRVEVEHAGVPVFEMTVVFELAFLVKEKVAYTTAWSEQAVRKAFYERQLVTTMLPFIRQLAVDGLTRVGLQSVVIPWVLPWNTGSVAKIDAKECT